MRLDMHSRREILNANCEEYQRASKKRRKELPGRLVPVTGLNRSYLATDLGTYDRNQEAALPGAKGKRAVCPKGKRIGRPVKYGEGFVQVLSAIWDDYGKPCGRTEGPQLPVPMIVRRSGLRDYGGNQRPALGSERG
jgi:hypothetical protein